MATGRKLDIDVIANEIAHEVLDYSYKEYGKPEWIGTAHIERIAKQVLQRRASEAGQ